MFGEIISFGVENRVWDIGRNCHQECELINREEEVGVSSVGRNHQFRGREQGE